MTTRVSVLDPAPQSLFFPLVVAVFLHLCMGGSLVVGDFIAGLLNPRGPIIDINDTMEVSLVQLKHTDAMPDRATVAPVPTGVPDTPAPPAPTPIRESDLTVPSPKPQPKGAPDRSTDRMAALRDAERRAAMAAALGQADREATDPNSDATESINLGAGGRADPEVARYVQTVTELFVEAFNAHKLTTERIAAANPGISAEYNVDFDPATGRIVGFSPHVSSNNPVYDKAVERAIQAVPSVPTPSARIADTIGTRFTITFEPP